ncbi:DUF2249 domain-containing protein [Vulgatibacter sp.]|uniref:DUF2249 domain-containing protein n=1 Tax=Vulgatibacter sp. TaxID=1971226 RepID=UPI003566FF92
MASLPDVVRAAGMTGARDLDVRPILAKGGDPFRLILSTVSNLAGSEALHLLVGFEPRPLYAVLRAQGLAAHTEAEGDLFHVWFYRDGAAAPAATQEDRGPLQEPFTMDVRGMEPPAPMVAILEKLAELGAGARLEVLHHREPVLLYDKLKLRGYAARTEKVAEGEYIVRIAPAWVFEA